MHRRLFIKNTSLTTLTLPALIAATASTAKAADTTVIAADFDLIETTIDELQKRMSSGELTSQKITEMYLKRIEEVDKNGPAINSVIEVNPDAISIAAAMDAERNTGKVRGPLHGIPILIKDNIDTGDKMMTTAGSLALAGNIAFKDAHIIKLLRESGAVLLGKTNLSEFANFRSTRSTSGWSSRGGQTKCPYVLNRNPSGSSAGTGAAVAANLCTVGIGTETDGSIISPSSVNGLVGIKPTVGLWSRSGIIPISATQDTAGPMARTVTDAAILLGALAGEDADDAVTKKSHGKAQKDYTKFLDADGLHGKRIGFDRDMLKGNSDVVALINNTLQLLKQKGATIVDVSLFKPISELSEAEYAVLEYEFKAGLDKYLGKANAPVKSLKEVIEFNNKNATIAMPFFKQEELVQSEARGRITSKGYLDAVAKSTEARKVIDGILQQYKLDAICGQSNGPACTIDLVNGDYDNGISTYSPAAMAGYPNITVPMGAVHNLPVGFSFFGTAYSESKLLSIAYAFEQATKHRTTPKFLETVV